MAEQKRIVGKRILLVEDDLGARESIKLLLTIDRHEVVEATGGAEAIELLKSQPFDLAILDYFMPGMQGSQVALRFREYCPFLADSDDHRLSGKARGFGQAGGRGHWKALFH